MPKLLSRRKAKWSHLRRCNVEQSRRSQRKLPVASPGMVASKVSSSLGFQTQPSFQLMDKATAAHRHHCTAMPSQAKQAGLACTDVVAAKVLPLKLCHGLQGSCMVWELPVRELHVLLWLEPQLRDGLEQYLTSISRRCSFQLAFPCLSIRSKAYLRHLAGNAHAQRHSPEGSTLHAASCNEHITCLCI